MTSEISAEGHGYIARLLKQLRHVKGADGLVELHAHHWKEGASTERSVISPRARGFEAAGGPAIAGKGRCPR